MSTGWRNSLGTDGSRSYLGAGGTNPGSGDSPVTEATWSRSCGTRHVASATSLSSDPLVHMPGQKYDAYSE